MSKVQLFIFRHGETNWNKEKRFQGHTDIPLNDLGKLQASELTNQLNIHKPDVILCSDLIRAVETAQIANQDLNAPMHFSSELRECFLGEPEGMYLDDIKIKYAPAVELWHSVKPEHDSFCFPNGETKLMHKIRLVNFIEKFCFENSSYKKVAVSTHGGSIRRLVHHCQNAPSDPIPVPNCSLFLIELDLAKKQWIFLP